MHIKEEHKMLLKSMGLTEEDFDLFDGKHVQYEYDEEKGVRIHDPFYETSYNEYIGIDGWSSWSSENDTFMHNIIKGVPEKAVVYVTDILQKVVNDEEWEEYCNETYVFSNFEKQDEFTNRIIQETEETILYLNKANLLVTYVKESPIHLLIVVIIIFSIISLLILSINKFKIKNITYDQIIAGGIFGFSGFFYYQTLLFEIPETINITSPTLIPRIWIITLAILSIVLFFRSNAIDSKKQDYKPKTVLIIILFLFAYLISMQWVGYFFTTPIFILATMYLLKYRKIPIMGIFAFGFVLFSYLIFNKLLHIDLPMGRWFV
jgi:hypothetical protein